MLSLLMFSQNPPGTTAGTTGGRLVSIGFALADYASATVVMLFVCNLLPAELPQRRLLAWLSSLFVVTVLGGFLGTYLPSFQFTSPTELLLPTGLRSDPYIAALVHPNAAQIQSVLGDEGGRAAAPWGYTNFWANNIAILLIWFVIAWGVGAPTRRRLLCGIVLTSSLVPIVYSLNRGLWIGLSVAALWVAVRLLLRGRVLALFAVVAVGAIGVIAFAATPLHGVIGSRLNHPGSNNIRAFLSAAAIDGANHSPIIGWGGTRKTIGSYSSIAIGKTPQCPQCGQFTVGSNGQFWTIIFNQGWVGAGFFLGFFGMTVWTYRRERSAVGQGGVVAVGLTLIYMVFYISVPSGLVISMISVALLARSRLDREPAQIA
ncbi:MAG: O-antigen ligase family protein [Jatrophihabitans sp.]